MSQPIPLEIQQKLDREAQAKMREAVQGPLSNRVPAKCKNPERCPMADGRHSCTQSVHTQCLVMCGLRLEDYSK